MDSPRKDSDRYLVVALFALGIIAIAGTYFSARVVSDRMIQHQAIETGEHWAGIVAKTVAAAEPGNWTAVEMALARELRTGTSFGHIDGVAVYGPDGQELAATRGEAGLGLRAGLEADAADHGAIADAVAGAATLRERQAADGEGTRLQADVYVPVALQGFGTGAMRVAIDHTGPARLFASGFETVTGVAAFVLWIAFMIPTFIAWRRVEDRRKAHEAIQYLAHHDTLTALPNRAQFNRALEDALSRAERHGKKVAVLCLDLDRFKDVNDTLGHPIGDGLLRTMAGRLSEAVREIDVIGRLGGDEFAVVAEDILDAEDTIPLAQRLCDAMAEPIQIEGHDIATSTSIGIAIAPDDGATAELVLKNADLALYRAKSDGRNTFRFFEREMDAALQKRRRIEHDMRQALQLGQFEMHYQPQYDLKTASLSGYEALLRWTHPESGPLAPDLFIPIAEESGLIVQIGAWVLEQACRDAAKWDESLRVAVNLSPAQFRNHDIVATVQGALAGAGLDPKRLELEITEGLLMSNTEATLDVLNRLRDLGISIAMDDFGTGYSSLSYLSRFPFDKIKIDRSFIDNLDRDREANAIVNTIINLGQSLDMTITAEGVETAEQAAFLRSNGCDHVQGFYYGAPAVDGSHVQIEDDGWAQEALLSEDGDALTPAWVTELRAMVDRDSGSKPADGPAERRAEVA